MTQRGQIPLGLLLYGAAAVAACIALWGAYQWVDNTWETDAGVTRGKAIVRAQWDKEKADRLAAEVRKVAFASEKLEVTNAAARIETRTIEREVDRVVEKPVYRNICLDDDGLRLARCAIIGKGSDSCKSDAPVRPAPPAGGRDGGERITLDYGSVSVVLGLRQD